MFREKKNATNLDLNSFDFVQNGFLGKVGQNDGPNYLFLYTLQPDCCYSTSSKRSSVD